MIAAGIASDGRSCNSQTLTDTAQAAVAAASIITAFKRPADEAVVRFPKAVARTQGSVARSKP